MRRRAATAYPEFTRVAGSWPFRAAIIPKLGIHFALVSPTFGFRGCDDRRLGPCRGPARAAPPAGAEAARRRGMVCTFSEREQLRSCPHLHTLRPARGVVPSSYLCQWARAQEPDTLAKFRFGLAGLGIMRRRAATAYPEFTRVAGSWPFRAAIIPNTLPPDTRQADPSPRRLRDAPQPSCSWYWC